MSAILQVLAGTLTGITGVDVHPLEDRVLVARQGRGVVEVLLVEGAPIPSTDPDPRLVHVLGDRVRRMVYVTRQQRPEGDTRVSVVFKGEFSLLNTRVRLWIEGFSGPLSPEDVGEALALLRGDLAANLLADDPGAALPLPVVSVDNGQQQVGPPDHMTAVIDLLSEAVLLYCSGRPVLFGHVTCEPKSLLDPKDILPALVLTASTAWSTATQVRQGKGGFTVSLATDPNSTVGFRLEGLRVASPQLFVAAVLHRLKRLTQGATIRLDPMIEEFYDALEAQNEPVNLRPC